MVSSRRELLDASDSSSAEELLSAAFSVWERRGRGWTRHPFPVELEPPFCSFYNLLDVPQLPVADDGRSQTFWSRLADDWQGKPTADHSSAIALYRRQLAAYQSAMSEAHEPIPCCYRKTDFVELQLVLPKDLKTGKTTAANLLLSFSYLSCPVSFEIIGTEKEIVAQFTCAESDAAQVKQQIKAHLPRSVIKETSEYLFDTWVNGESESLIVDFGLSNEFFLSLKTQSYLETDLLVAVIGALSDLEEDEVGVFQVLFNKTRNDWAQDAVQAVGYLEETGTYPKSFGALPAVREKTKTPLFATCLCVASRSYSEGRTWRIVKSLGAGLTILSNPSGNELM